MLKAARSDSLEWGEPIELLCCFGPPLVTVGSNRLVVFCQVRLVVWSNVRFGSPISALKSRWWVKDVFGALDRVRESVKVQV